MNGRKTIFERLKLRPSVTCSINPFQPGIPGVFDDFLYNQSRSGAVGNMSPASLKTSCKSVTEIADKPAFFLTLHCLSCETAVSYTHLDVYKRQVLHIILTVVLIIVCYFQSSE